MNHTPDLLNHPALRPYKDSICATARPCAEITLLPAEHLTLWQSKLGGQPYWPKEMEYPRNAKGRPLHLLAQINFAGTPPLPDSPEKGILQFFISRNDGIEKMWGMNAENPADQQGFRVVYHADIEHEQDRLLQDFRFLAQARQTPKSNHILQRLAAFWHSQRPGLPFEHACAMRFERQQKYASLEKANGVFLAPGLLPMDAENITREFLEAFYRLDWSGHRLGGYANILQEKWRLGAPYQDHVLLLQIDCDVPNGVMRHGSGICHFYIHPHDLRQRDFSKALYTWEFF